MDMQLAFLTPGGGALPSRAPARLLEFQPSRSVAFAAHATIGLVEKPRWTHVPGAPAHAIGLMPWAGRELPLLDLAALLAGSEADTQRAQGHALVLAYQRSAGRPVEYGALCAPALVKLVEVADDQQCALPSDSMLWPRLARACFLQDGRAVPIPDVARLFALHPH